MERHTGLRSPRFAFALINRALPCDWVDAKTCQPPSLTLFWGPPQMHPNTPTCGRKHSSRGRKLGYFWQHRALSTIPACDRHHTQVLAHATPKNPTNHTNNINIIYHTPALKTFTVGEHDDPSTPNPLPTGAHTGMPPQTPTATDNWALMGLQPAARPHLPRARTREGSALVTHSHSSPAKPMAPTAHIGHLLADGEIRPGVRATTTK